MQAGPNPAAFAGLPSTVNKKPRRPYEIVADSYQINSISTTRSRLTSFCGGTSVQLQWPISAAMVMTSSPGIHSSSPAPAPAGQTQSAQGGRLCWGRPATAYLVLVGFTAVHDGIVYRLGKAAQQGLFGRVVLDLLDHLGVLAHLVADGVGVVRRRVIGFLGRVSRTRRTGLTRHGGFNRT